MQSPNNPEHPHRYAGSKAATASASREFFSERDLTHWLKLQTREGKQRPWTLVGFMWVALLLNYADRQVVFSIFPILKSELHFTDTQLGLTGSMFLWVYALCSPIAGQMADWFSKRILVVISLLLWSVVTAVTGLSTSAFMLLACRSMIGVTESLFFPTAVALIANTHGPRTRSRAISLFDTAQLAGVVLGGWFGGYVAEEYHWRLAFYSLGIAGIVYAAPYFAFLRGVNEEVHVETQKSGSGLAIFALIKIPTYRLLVLTGTTLVFALWFLYTWLPNFFFEKYSMSLSEAGFTGTVFLQSGTAVGLLSGGLAADLLYRRTPAARFWLVSFGLLFCAPCLHAIGSAPSLALTKLAAFAFGLCAGVFIANLAASAFDVVPGDARASAVGFLNLISSMTSGFGALIGGLWKQSVGMHRLMTYSSIACFVAGIGLILTVKTYFQRDYDRIH